MGVDVGLGGQHLRNRWQLGSGSSGGAGGATRDQHMHIAKLGGSRHRAAGWLRKRAVLMIGKNKHRHGQITFASLRSLSTSSATDPTFLPAWRLGGSSTFSTVRRGAGSTPKSAGFMISIGFLRAFMMFGSDA